MVNNDTKDEFRIEWLYENEPVGISPTVWQRRETAERHAEEYLQVIRTDMGIDLANLTWRVQGRFYSVTRTDWQ